MSAIGVEAKKGMVFFEVELATATVSFSMGLVDARALRRLIDREIAKAEAQIAADAGMAPRGNCDCMPCGPWTR